MKNFLNVAYSSSKKKVTTVYPNALVKHLIKKFYIKENSKLFEPGFGRGEFLYQFQKMNMQCYGIDYSIFSEKNKLDLDLSNLKIHDAESFPYPFEDNFFDVIYSKSFIEHFYYTDKLMKEFFRILKPGGKIITLTPNWTYMYKIFYDSCTHRTPFTKKSLQDLHEIIGFKNVRCENFKQIPSLWDDNIFLNFASEITRKFFPNHFIKKNKWIRFSKEIMILCYAEKN